MNTIDLTTDEPKVGEKIRVAFEEHATQVVFFSTCDHLTNTVIACELLKKHAGLEGDFNKAEYFVVP